MIATGFTPAQIRDLTVYQGFLYLAEYERVEKLGRYRQMTPAVQSKMREIEGFQLL